MVARVGVAVVQKRSAGRLEASLSPRDPGRKGESMKQTAVVVAALLVGLLIWAGLRFVPSHQDGSSPERATGQRPNILFILADDLRASDLDYMPNTQNLLANQGVKFTKAWVTRSLCCPSRATILRGQYAHNHKVWVNVPPSGGFWRFHDRGLEDSTIATWLDDAGYDTVLIGKYFSPYGFDRDGQYGPTTYVPPGWDRWHAWEGKYRETDTEFDVNHNGQVVTYYRALTHDTDLYTQTAERFIRDTAGSAPFFMYLSPNAPHYPSYYAPRHADLFSDTPLPKPPSFNEKDVSDKPAWVRNKPLLSTKQVQGITTFHRDRLRALQSVDEMVGRLADALRDTGEISNTYIVLTSDNGIYLGEHRLRAKAAAYNASSRVPLLVRGPSVPQGVIRSQMVLNNDLAPTFADLGGVQVPSFVDGRSLKPLLTTSPPGSWRTAFLVEHRRSAEEHASVRAIPNYDAVRTSRYHYVEYPTTGEKELYDLNADPYELTNIYASAPPTLLSDLKTRLEALKSCAGVECKRSEDGG
jgi:N-acetylglucosamine-6-sulfatase